MFAGMIASIPSDSGAYALWLKLRHSHQIQVGQLGEFTFLAGDYIYLGSARGPGGLRARLGRHLRGNGKIHWHIDYLRTVGDVRGYCYATTNALHRLPMECWWSQTLAALPGATIPAEGFGASDCRSGCRAHLIASNTAGRDLLQWLALNAKAGLILFE